MQDLIPKHKKFAEADQLEATIRKNLEVLGYGK
jgi:hypothetical protein